MLRIAIVTREFPPETSWGGIGSFYENYAQRLRDAGCDVEIFTQGLHSTHSYIYDDLLVHRVKLDVPHPSGDRPGSMPVALAKALHDKFSVRHHVSPFDIVEGHEHLGVNYIINTSVSIPTVTRVHTSYTSLVERRLVTWPRSSEIRAIEAASLKTAQAVVAPSSFIKRVTKEDFHLNRRIDVIPHFCPTSSASPTFNERTKQCLFVGRLDEKVKQPLYAFKSFEQLHDLDSEWRLIVAGTDLVDENGRSVYEKCLSSIGEEARRGVRFAGFLTKPELDDLYARATFLLFPSRFESFGLVIVEAMQKGCIPLVLSGTAGADIVSDARLTVPTGDVTGMAAAAIRLLCSPRTLADVRRRLKDRFDRHYSVGALVAKNISLYKQLLSNSRSTNVRDFVPSENRVVDVSVITPVYNTARYIADNIATVRSASYRIEHIVCDGGSTDTTVAVAKRTRHPASDLIVYSAPDVGQSHAINRGLLASRGRIVCYLNADDEYVPDTLDFVVEYFDKHPNASVLVGDCIVIDENGKETDYLRAVYNGHDGILRYWGWNDWHCIPQPSVFLRREVIARCGLFDVTLNYAMDLEYWLRTSRTFDFDVINRPLSRFRMYPSSKTVGQTYKMFLEEYAVFERYVTHQTPDKQHELRQEVRPIYRKKLLHAAATIDDPHQQSTILNALSLVGAN